MSAREDHIAVIGVGASSLIVELLRDGFVGVEAVDVAPAALERLREELGVRADEVVMRVADARTVQFDSPLDLWHDRAVFHFLVSAADRRAYVARAAEAVRPGGHLVVGTFATSGPQSCSGLPVRRYDVEGLVAEFGDWFDLIESTTFDHRTPSGAIQPFVHVVMRRRHLGADDASTVRP